MRENWRLADGVVVPDVVGMDLDDAHGVAHAAGLKLAQPSGRAAAAGVDLAGRACGHRPVARAGRQLASVGSGRRVVAAADRDDGAGVREPRRQSPSPRSSTGAVRLQSRVMCSIPRLVRDLRHRICGDMALQRSVSQCIVQRGHDHRLVEHQDPVTHCAGLRVARRRSRASRTRHRSAAAAGDVCVRHPGAESSAMKDACGLTTVSVAQSWHCENPLFGWACVAPAP